MNPTLTYPSQPPRYYNGGYRYFFNGQEADNEVLGDGALHAFEYRMHDTQIGRFWSVDPLAGKFPWNSTYAFAENQVVEGRAKDKIGITYFKYKSSFKTTDQEAVVGLMLISLKSTTSERETI